MGLRHTPEFQLTVEGQDITRVVSENLISLTVTDKAGGESDQLQIQLVDTGFELPKRGRVLRLALGFNGQRVSKGAYTVDEITVSGPPSTLQITAKAAPMDSQKHKGKLQTQKTRSWDQISIGDLVASVAAEHGLVPRVNEQLAQKVIQHVDQANESDMNLLTRLARQYGAVSKPANGFWLFLKDGEGKTAGGAALPLVSLTPEQVSRWQARFNSRNKVQRVVAQYHDAETGGKVEVATGHGEPEFRIAFTYPNRDEAEAAAKARAKSVQSGSDNLDVSMSCTPELVALAAEGHLQLDGFREGVDGRWRVTQVVHALTGSGLQLRIVADHGAAGGD